MRSKIDGKTLAERWNRLRMEHQTETFSAGEFVKLLKSNGFNSQLTALFLKKEGTFVCTRKQGTKKLVKFSSLPVHMAVFDELLQSYHKQMKEMPRFSEEEAIRFLKARGYRIFHCVGIDEARLERENPALYKKYLKEEEL